MELYSQQVIDFLKILSNNLLIGRNIEYSLRKAFENTLELQEEKEKWIKYLNLGLSIDDILIKLAKETKDKSLSRIWLLTAKITKLSTYNAGKKLLTIAQNLERNHILVQKRDSLIKAQKYKVTFLNWMTAFFLGIIASLAPFFI
ncbi:MAG: hypothetical protein EU542_09015, partial [Promethearchaeota archaeon]